MQEAKFEVDYTAYKGFHCKKKIFLKVVLQKENYAHTEKSTLCKGKELTYHIFRTD